MTRYDSHTKFWHPVYATAAAVALVAITGLTAPVTTRALASDDPANVTVGKPHDISQELFAKIRGTCAAKWSDDYNMRVVCERIQFEAVRKLRGQ